MTGMKLVLAVAIVVGLSARADAGDAQGTLRDVQRFYASMSQLTGTFTQTVTNATFNRTSKSTGKMWVQKPARFRFDYDAKKHRKRPAKTFLYDGTTFSYVNHQNLEITQRKPDGSTLPAAVSFLTGGASLAKDFTLALDASGTYGGPDVTVLALTPKQANAEYKQVLFVVEADGHIRASIVIGNNDDINRFDFTAVDTKATIAAATFQLAPEKQYPTYRVVRP
jgi:outer membrane lipoprotein carrier protein